MKTRFAAAALLLLTFSPRAHADEASKRQKIDRLLASMHVDHLSEQIMQMAKSQAEKSMANAVGMQNATPEQKRLAADFQTRVMEIVSQSMGWKALEPQFVDLYAKTFSEPEIDGMVAFYASPTGQAVIAKMPQLTMESMRLAQSHMAEVEPKIRALAQEYAQKMQAAGKSQGKS